MKTYLVSSDTNYGLMVHIVNADTPKEALRLAETYSPGAWDGAEVKEINTKTPGVVLWEEARG
jgi:hypothetical protein